MIEFTKMHGLGNDYIYINNIAGKNYIPQEKISQFTRYICNRNFGVGADGIILIKESKIADLKMEIYNSDGSGAEMCGNGIRCFGKYVYENKIVEKKSLRIETLAGIRQLFLHTKNNKVVEVTVNMGKPIWDNEKIPINLEHISKKDMYKKTITLQADDWKVEGMAISMGNPHFVIIVKNVDEIDLNKYGKIIENASCFPNKTNVEFIQILGNRSIKMRVWERGSGETFACGTGACAAFAVCYERKLVVPEAKVYLKGGELKIALDRSTNNIYMTGLATKVCDGEIGDVA